MKPEKVKVKVDRVETTDSTVQEVMDEIRSLIEADLAAPKPGNPNKEYRVELRRFSKRC